MYEETTNFYGDDRKQNYLPPPRSCPFVVSRVFSSARQVSSSWFISIRSHSLSAAWLGRFVTTGKRLSSVLYAKLKVTILLLASIPSKAYNKSDVASMFSIDGNAR